MVLWVRVALLRLGQMITSNEEEGAAAGILRIIHRFLTSFKSRYGHSRYVRKHVSSINVIHIVALVRQKVESFMPSIS